MTAQKNAPNTGKPGSHWSDTTDKNTESNAVRNANMENRESNGSMQDYVSGDAARSSSSHQFHKNATDKNS